MVFTVSGTSDSSGGVACAVWSCTYLLPGIQRLRFGHGVNHIEIKQQRISWLFLDNQYSLPGKYIWIYRRNIFGSLSLFYEINMYRIYNYAVHVLSHFKANN